MQWHLAGLPSHLQEQPSGPHSQFLQHWHLHWYLVAMMGFLLVPWGGLQTTYSIAGDSAQKHYSSALPSTGFSVLAPNNFILYTPRWIWRIFPLAGSGGSDQGPVCTNGFLLGLLTETQFLSAFAAGVRSRAQGEKEGFLITVGRDDGDKIAIPLCAAALKRLLRIIFG